MDELLGTRVPQSAQAEQAVIGAMLIDPECVPTVLKDARPEHFYSRVNREIFETVLTMFNYGEQIDSVTLMARMQELGYYHEETTRAYLTELIRVTPTTANLGEYLRILKDKALQRDLAQVAADISSTVQEGLGSATDMLELAERSIYALRRDRSIGGLKPVGEAAQAVYDELVLRRSDPERKPGLDTGLYDLDNCLLGMNPGELILVASRPGMGKSSIALNIALHVARSTRKTVAVFSLEMSREQLASRLISGAAMLPNEKLQRATVTESELRRVAQTVGELSKTRILIDDNPMLSVADMNAQCRRIGEDLALVVVDYLQLMQSAGGKNKGGGENRQAIVADISRMMKIMAKDLHVPVLCLSQLSRAAEGREDKRPRLSDLRESGAIEQDADVVIGLYRESYYNQESASPNEAQLLVLKNRRGQIGKIDVAWMPEYTSYGNLDKRHQEPG